MLLVVAVTGVDEGEAGAAEVAVAQHRRVSMR